MAAQIQGQQTEYKPWGITAGAMVGREQADMDAANLLALQDSQLGNVVKAKEAALAQDEMNNDAYRQARMEGMIGDSQVKTAAGKTAMGTQESDMNAKIAENLAKVPKARVEKALAETHQQTMGLMGLASALEQGGGSDLNFVAKAMEMAPSLGMKPQDLQQLLANPELLKKKLAQNQQMLTMVPAVLQKMAEQAQAGTIQEGIHAGDRTSHEKIASGNNSTSIQVANINAQSRLDAAKMKGRATDIIAQAQAGKLSYEKAATALEMMANFTDDPTEAAKYKDLASRFDIANQKSRAAGRQVPVDLGAMGVQTQSITSNLGGSSNFGQTKSGVKFKVVK